MKRCEMVFRSFICTMLVFSLSFSVNATNYQKAGNSSSVETCLVDEKIYSNVTLEQDFCRQSCDSYSNINIMLMLFLYLKNRHRLFVCAFL
jgi:hypothetical protein